MPPKSNLPEGLSLTELTNALCLSIYNYRPEGHSEKVIEAVRDPERVSNRYNPELKEFRYTLPNSGAPFFSEQELKPRAKRGYALSKHQRMPGETRTAIEYNCMKFVLEHFGVLQEPDKNQGRLKSGWDYANEVAQALNLSDYARDINKLMQDTVNTFIDRTNNRGASGRG